MDSINAKQPEQNHKDLQAVEAVEKIKAMVKKAQSCFFCTALSSGKDSAARPMNVRKVDDRGNLWFLSSIDSHKNLELEKDSKVKLFFQGSSHADFLEINGQATVSKDKEQIKELWEPVLKTWFTAGIDDPRISVIKVEPRDGYYWDHKHGNAIAGLKMMFGAALGKTLDDSIEGKIDL